MEKLTMTNWPAGLAWRNHFRRSLLEELEPGARDGWGPGERELLGASLAQFQLGESSGGLHLLRYARQFGDGAGDAWLGEAMALFIQEENRHSQWLGEFLKAQEYPLLGKCWSDDIFRIARKLLGFGLMVAVLVCAEIIAVPYYAAVREATSSRWLRSICSRLLTDEAVHLRFQASNLGAVWGRWKYFRWLKGLHRAMMVAMCLLAWWEHRRVLAAGNHTLVTFIHSCVELLDGVHEAALAAPGRALSARVPAAVR